MVRRRRLRQGPRAMPASIAKYVATDVQGWTRVRRHALNVQSDGWSAR